MTVIHAEDQGAYPLAACRTQLVRTDANMRVIDFNEAASRLFGEALARGTLIYEVWSEAGFAIARLPGPDEWNGHVESLPATLFLSSPDGKRFLVASSTTMRNVTFEITDVSMILPRETKIPFTVPGRIRFRDAIEQLKFISEPSPHLIGLQLRLSDGHDIERGTPRFSKFLEIAGKRLASSITVEDHLFYLGETTFAVITREQQIGEVVYLSQRLLDLLCRTYLIDGDVLEVGVSIGVVPDQFVAVTPDDCIEMMELTIADARTKDVTSASIYSAALKDVAHNRKALERDLRRAVALEEFAVAYQPQFDIDGKTLRGFEALLRWPGKQISPAVFIPLAEEIGLIEAIGEWVLQSACREATLWTADLTISVNVSPLQFRNPDFEGIVANALLTAGLPPSRLELEITEGALIGDPQTVLTALQRLTSKGIRIALDDFGTGYSSLSYLRRFPFHKLKIDQSFVRNMDASPPDSAIVAAIITLGKALGMVTIAEGVETQDQLLHLGALGCDEVQGYLTGRPLAPDAVRDLLRTMIDASPQGDLHA